MARYPEKKPFVPTNPQKCLNKKPIIARSSWEYTAMSFLDRNSKSSSETGGCIQYWASEMIEIPYYNPIKKLWTTYKPDLLVCYMDKNNKQHIEIIEIKPMKEDPRYLGEVSRAKRLTQVINQAKFQAAVSFCAKRNWVFRIMTEKDLFGFTPPSAKK